MAEVSRGEAFRGLRMGRREPLFAKAWRAVTFIFRFHYSHFRIFGLSVAGEVFPSPTTRCLRGLPVTSGSIEGGRDGRRNLACSSPLQRALLAELANGRDDIFRRRRIVWVRDRYWGVFRCAILPPTVGTHNASCSRLVIGHGASELEILNTLSYSCLLCCAVQSIVR